MLIRIKVESNGTPPKKANDFAACHDAYAREIEYSEGTAKVKLGFSTSIPSGYKGCIVARSNMTKYPWILSNGVAQIDSDYRGEWIAVFKSLSSSPFPYKIGDRVAQIYFEKVINPIFLATDELDKTERGEEGFGSTGK